MYDKKEIFISYKAEEFKEANDIRLLLEAKGYSCWMAPMSISGGASYASEIPAAIRNCKIYLLILSELAQKSKWIPRELDQAINDGKIILPFVIKKCDLEDEFAFYLSNVQRYEAWSNKEDALNKLLAEISYILGPKEIANPNPIKDITKEDTSTVNQTVTPKIKKTEKKAKDKQKIKAGNKKTVFSIIAAILLVVIGIVFITMPKKITIAGKDIESDSYLVYLDNTTVSESDLDKLSTLENLNSISFTDCTMPSAAAQLLAGDNLYTLKFINCNITDSFLNTLDFSAMSKLNTFSIEGNSGITNLDPLLEVADSLTSLNISHTGITDISNLSEFTKLIEFNADNLNIQDISCLEQLDNLRFLSLNHNQLKDLNALSNCIYLERIHASDNEIVSLEGLKNATKLTSVKLNNNQIEDISVLAKSSATLVTVYLSNNKLTDLSALSDARTLEYVSLDNNKINNIEFLKTCLSLKEFSAKNNMISSINGIQYCTKLQFIDLSNNQIQDLSIFNGMSFEHTNGIILNLMDNKIETMVIPEAEKFRCLALTGNQLKNQGSLKNVAGYTLFIDYSEIADYTNWKDSGFSEIYMTNCPLDKRVHLEEQIGMYKIHFIEMSETKDRFQSFIPDNMIEE